MDTPQYLLERIQNPKNFSAFVNENMKTSTYKVDWTREMEVEYEPGETFQEYTADYAAAMLGTVIDTNADRPKHDMPSIGEISGTLSRIGDEWQIPNDRLKKYYYMENRFRSHSVNMTEVQKKEQFSRIVKYLFNPYELAAIAPHRRIWAQYLEIYSDGITHLTKTNNEGGIIWSQPFQFIKKYLMPADGIVWNQTNKDDIDVLATLRYLEDLADAAGKKIIKHRISKATAAMICQCKQFKDLIGLTPGPWKTDTTPGIGLDTINQYLASINGTGFPPFEVVDERGYTADGKSFSLFKDGRIVGVCADRVATLKVTDALESIDPIPNKVYTQFQDNLISQWRNDNGRYVAYEMFAFPAFTGRNDLLILDLTQKEA